MDNVTGQGGSNITNPVLTVRKRESLLKARKDRKQRLLGTFSTGVREAPTFDSPPTMRRKQRPREGSEFLERKGPRWDESLDGE